MTRFVDCVILSVGVSPTQVYTPSEASSTQSKNNLDDV